MSLTANPGVANLIPAWSHTFVEIDHEIISTVILLPSAKAKKRKCLVSSYPTDPNILGPTKTFLKTFRICKSIFRLFLTIFILFPYKKVFIKKKVCLPTDLKNFDFGHVTGNKTYFSFGLNHLGELLSVTSESMCTNYWLTACSSLPKKKCGSVN